MAKQLPDLSFSQLINISFGFFGVQIAYALQSANISRIFATLGADPHSLSFFWLLPPIMGMIVQPLVGKYSDRTWTRWGRRIPYLFVGALVGNAAQASISDATPSLVLAMAIFVLAFVVFALVKIPEPFQTAAAQNVTYERTPWAFRHFLLGCIAIFFYVGVEVGIPNIANLYMTSDNGLGMDTAVAGTVCGTYWFLMLIGRLIGGFLGMKVGSRPMLTFVTTLALAFVLLAMFLPESTVTMPVFNSNLSFSLEAVRINLVMLVLCGLCTSVMWGCIFNLAVEGLGKYTAKASGLFMMMVCGGGILPLIQGYVADHIGYLTSYWVIALGIAFMLWYALIGSKNVNKDIVTE
mgnify:CR=1 FL=1